VPSRDWMPWVRFPVNCLLWTLSASLFKLPSTTQSGSVGAGYGLSVRQFNLQSLEHTGEMHQLFGGGGEVGFLAVLRRVEDVVSWMSSEMRPMRHLCVSLRRHP
jgi:hypothetical protein